MKKILAISGGVDSMCLLHMMKDDSDVVVAHFNHGTRASADDDQNFVEEFALKYRLPFYTEKANLGANVSEATAREARYNFLRKLASELDGKIYTAHHLNDLCESIAINLLRGTGWRGLTPFYNAEIEHPMLHFTKSEIYRYASKNQIVFRQDPTNNEDIYLRNRLRPAVAEFIKTQPDAAKKLDELYSRQCDLRKEIEQNLSKLFLDNKAYPRNLFKELDNETAEELLRSILMSHNISVTRPQLRDFLDAVRAYDSGKKFNLPRDRLVRFNKSYFML